MRRIGGSYRENENGVKLSGGESGEMAALVKEEMTIESEGNQLKYGGENKKENE